MSIKHPLISVITVTYQAASTLEKSVISVLQQKRIFEYIIIDGNSTDGTIDIIKKYQSEICYWESAKDIGIYDAMNKGLRKANGKWIYFLGADDILSENIFTVLYDLLLSLDISLIYANVQYDYGKYFKSSFGLKTFLHNTIHHQAAFYNRSLFDNFNYDISLKIIADYELNLLIYTKRLSSLYVDRVIAICSGGGSSYNIALSKFETNKVRAKYVGKLTNFFFKKILDIKYFISYVLLRKV